MNLNDYFETYRNKPCEKYLADVLQESQSLIFGIVVKVTNQTHDAEDITQEILIKVIQNINLLPQNINFGGWLNRVSLNAAIDHYHQKQRIKALKPNLQEINNAYSIENEDEKIAIIYQHLSKLESNEESLILNKYIHLLTYDQMSILYKQPRTTIESKINNILKKLKVSIEKAGFAGVAMALASTLDQLKAVEVSLDLLPKVKEFFPSAYPEASIEVLKTNLYEKSFASTIKGKILETPIGVILMVIVASISIYYGSTFQNAKLKNDKTELSEKSFSNKDEIKNSSLMASANDEKQKSAENSIETTNQSLNKKIATDNQLLATPASKVEDSAIEKKEITRTIGKTDYEITLFDGEKKELLKNYEVEVSFSQPLDIRYGDEDQKTQTYKVEKYKSDKNGNIYFPALLIRNNYLQIFTKDYAVHCTNLTMGRGKGSYLAKLYRGGAIEVHAINQKDKIAEGLMMRFKSSKNDHRFHGSTPLKFDIIKGIYLTPNLPLGSQEFYFQAKGYQDSSLYILRVELQNNSKIKVKMLLARKLYFDLESQEKPTYITILPWQFGALILDLKKDSPKAFRNQNNLYELELYDNKAVSVIVCVDKQAPQTVNLLPEKDTYKIPNLEGFQGKLKIQNKDGKSVIGANISYQVGFVRQTVASDENGIAILSGLFDRMEIELSISAEGYKYSNGLWSYQSKDTSIKTITLKEVDKIEAKNFFISGKVKFGEKSVVDAKVFLFHKIKRNYQTFAVSDAEGNFIFKNVAIEAGQTIYLLACHSELGIVTSDNYNVEKNIELVELNLVKEKSLMIKLIDSAGKPLPNKNITLSLQDTYKDKDGLYWPFSSEIITDQNGEYQFYNLIHGLYNITLDNELKLKNNQIKIPNEIVVLKTEQRLLKKVVVKLSEGGEFKGVLKVESNHRWGRELKDPILCEDGNYYLEIDEIKLEVITFEIPGYAIVRKGPYAGIEDLPEVFNIEFQKGESIKITVVDDLEGKPISFTPVSVFYEYKKLISLPTNEHGEVTFSHLMDEKTVEVIADGYMAYENDFDFSKSKEIFVRLKKGGGLKGNYTIAKEVLRAEILLTPNYNKVNVSADNSFEFFNLKPGEYELRILIYFKDDKRQNVIFSTKIIIENEKVFEINLDEFFKNETILDISIFNRGALATGEGVINIINRNDREVYSVNISNGKHLVERILPGEYLLSYSNDEKQRVDKIINITSQQNNIAELLLPSSKLVLNVINESGEKVGYPVLRLYVGEKYGAFNSFLLATDHHLREYNLSPKQSYFILIEADYVANYQANLVGPIILEEGQSKYQEVILASGKKLPKIQIVDAVGKPIENASFMESNKNGAFIQRKKGMGIRVHLYSDKNGFLPENGWPKDDFNLIVFKEGYDFRELKISAEIDPDQLIQIKLNNASSIQCNLPQVLSIPISIGILNSKEILIERPVPYTLFDDKIFGVYFENITQGNVKFSGLAAGTYYIGFYLNGSTKMISKQGPYAIGEGENLKVTSTFQEIK